MPKLGIAPRLPRPQRGVLLLDYFGGMRQLEDSGTESYSQPSEVECYHLKKPPNQLRPSGLEPEFYPWKG